VSAEWLRLGQVRSRVRLRESSSLGFAFQVNTSLVMAHVPQRVIHLDLPTTSFSHTFREEE
jgi:hypothetical protein